MLKLYSFLTGTVGSLVFPAILSRRARAGREDITRLNERKGAPQMPRPQGKLIWFHGASVGETLSCLPIIHDILAADPTVHVMVTSGTVTSAKLMAERLPARAFHQFMPLDHPKWTAQFLDHWHPDAVLWMESDFWPNMMLGAQKRQIPMALINARMSEKSFKTWSRFAQKSLARLLSSFSFCLTQSAEEQERLKAFGHPDVRIMDNLKYAAAPLPIDKNVVKDLHTQISGRPVWQYVSTHPDKTGGMSEEDIAVRVHKTFLKNIPNLLTVIAPRHPKRGTEIANRLAGEGLKITQRSKAEKITADTDIYIADTLGELGGFFKTIDLTVIGGSFVPHGGHNPIEPAQFKNCILYGPHMFNFKTMIQDFKGTTVQCADVESLTKKLHGFLTRPETKQPYKNAAYDVTVEKSSAQENLWKTLKPWLFKDTVTS